MQVYGPRHCVWVAIGAGMGAETGHGGWGAAQRIGVANRIADEWNGQTRPK
jgi:hypothetical protein